MRNHAKPTGLAFLALVAGLLSGCGGESGGLPSGIGGALQGVTLKSTFVTLNTTDPSVTGETAVAPDVIVGLSGAGQAGASVSPTSRIDLVLKNAGLNQADVVVPLIYLDPSTNLTAPGAAGDEHTFDVGTDAKVNGNVTAQRDYLVNTSASTNPAARYLVGLVRPADRAAILGGAAPVAGTPRFEFKGKVQSGQETDAATVLTAINGSLTLQQEILAGSSAQLNGKYADGTSSAFTVQYQPKQIFLRKNVKFDVAVEFYATLDPTTNAPPTTPFFVSFLKNAAEYIGNQVVIEPTNLGGVDAFDPARYYAAPITGSATLTGLPKHARAILLRVAEENLGSETKTSYEKTYDLNNLAAADGTYSATTGTATLNVGFINRLRAVAAQAQVFYDPTPSDTTLAADLTDVVATAPIAVAESSGDVIPTAGQQKILFGSIAANSRISSYSLTPSTLTLVPNSPQSVDVYANLAAVTANPPFDALASVALRIPAGSRYFSAPSFSGSFGAANLNVDTSDSTNGRIVVKALTADVTPPTGTLSFTVDLPLATGTPAGNAVASVNLSVTPGVNTAHILATVSNIPAGARSVVLYAKDTGDNTLVYRQELDLTGTQTTSGTVTVNVADRSFPFTLSAEAYSGASATGALLASGTKTDANVSPGTTTYNVALGSGQTYTLTYSGAEFPAGSAIRGAHYSPTLTDGSGNSAPAGLATYTSSDTSLATVNSSTGVVTIVAGAAASVQTVTITAKTSGGTTLATDPLTIGPDQFTFTATNPPPQHGGIRYTLTEGGSGNVVYTNVFTSTATIEVGNHGNPYTPKVELYSNDDGTGVVLASVTGTTDYGFTTSTESLSANLTTGNLVTQIDGATVGGIDLQNFAFVRSKTYRIDPTLLLSGNSKPIVPIKLLNVSFGGDGAALFTQNLDGTITIGATPASNSPVAATITLEYRLAGEASAPAARTKVFNVTVKPASGGAGGTIG